MKILVYILDNDIEANGERMAANCEVTFNPTMMIYSDHTQRTKEILGQGTLVREGDKFYLTDIKTLENKYIENAIPAIGGKIESRLGPVITKFSIDCVAFTGDQNVDPRIKRVRDQIND